MIPGGRRTRGGPQALLRYLYILGLSVYCTGALGDDAAIRVWLESERNGDTLLVKPRAEFTTGDRPIRYEVVSTKNGTTGRSTTSQSGMVLASAVEGAPFTTLRLSLHEGERAHVSVKLYEGARLAAHAEARYPE